MLDGAVKRSGYRSEIWTPVYHWRTTPPTRLAATCSSIQVASSETEILFAYGSSSFAARTGTLAASHFLTLTSGREQRNDFGNFVLWEGAQQIEFAAMD
jgi:hypothetical protein